VPVGFIIFFALLATVSGIGVVQRVRQWRRNPNLFREMVIHGLPPASVAGRYWLRAMPLVPLFFFVGIIGDAQAVHFVNTKEGRSAWMGLMALAGLVAFGGVFVELSNWSRLPGEERRRRATGWQNTQRHFYGAFHPRFTRWLSFGRAEPVSGLPWWVTPLFISLWASFCVVVGGLGFLRSVGLA
jgi:hypothetical protein